MPRGHHRWAIGRSWWVSRPMAHPTFRGGMPTSRTSDSLLASGFPPRRGHVEFPTAFEHATPIEMPPDDEFLTSPLPQLLADELRQELHWQRAVAQNGLVV